LLTSIVVYAQDAQPDRVVLPGTIQSVLGCDGDWLPDGDCSALTFSEEDNVWMGTFDLPAGSYEYKVAVNGTWDENYGGMADAGGPNVEPVLAEDASVTFIYDHATHWVADSVNRIIANVPGSFQSELGCPGDWAPDCLRSWLQDPEGDGIYTFVTTSLPAGDYEAKVAINQTWDVNYGAEGAAGGENIAFSVPADFVQVTVTYNTADNAIEITIDESIVGAPAAAAEGEAPAAAPSAVKQPDMVVIPGTIQNVLGCAGDWDPACENTALTLDVADSVWVGTFDIPAGDYEYKVAINGTWDENYGGMADADGANVVLSLAEDTTVTFVYDHATHWVADSVNHLIATAPGSYQNEVGCVGGGVSGDWDPACLRTWLQDPDNDGVYTNFQPIVPEGNWEVKVAINQTWDLNYGAEGQANGSNIQFEVPSGGGSVTFSFDSSTNILSIEIGEPQGELSAAALYPPTNLAQQTAHWVTRDTIAWELPTMPAETVYRLHYHPDGRIRFDSDLAFGIVGGRSLQLTVDPDGLSADILARFPHLEGYTALRIAPEDVEKVPDILRGQFYISAGAGGNLLTATGLQIAGVLDDLYTTDAALGVTWNGDAPSIAVWAPTAQTVRLHLFADSSPHTSAAIMDMTRDDATGVWSVTGDASWAYKFYLFEVTVWAPSVQQVVTNAVTDPYSLSLSMNSARSQIVNMSSALLEPAGWDTATKPQLAAPEDIVIYELHVRDFSAFDETVPAEHRGTFMAFTHLDSNGMQHLTALAQAGLTHVHLLPLFDIATINEDAAQRQEPSIEALSTLPPDSEEQQELWEPLRDLDAFNWGYDPFHFNTPEGSYSTNPDGRQRIIEFRAAVQALNSVGLRVVMDVVYNHTNASGQSDRSVFDRIVPGYYHRLNNSGGVETSTCCQNTATEHNMMERFMVDSVVMWARDYRVDGFRFDLMGHHMLDNMQAVRAALDALTMENDGVDGQAIYVYGEGWNFGEVANNARGVQASQLNLGGTGIGSFNDRLRDGARGGPFENQQFQHFLAGLYFTPNGITEGDSDAQLQRLLHDTDLIRIGLAGNLRDYPLVNAAGESVTGADIDYNGSPAGYTLDPQENIVYISAHDNLTIWDRIMLASPAEASIQDRVRMNNVGHSIVALAQGVPFFHAGDDILRSKSGDGNSYNSGDWFNRLDFTYQFNNWAVGLPPDRNNWEPLRGLLGNPDLMVTNDDIMDSLANFEEMLQIRRSSPLFRLQTAQDVIDRVSFLNTGPDQMPGVIVYVLSDGLDGADLDPNAVMIVVIVNISPEAITFADAAFAGLDFQLHPVQQASRDEIVQTAAFADDAFTVPARTTAVFVVPQ
jgi:pullulanase-type alpha-1,6-glucosidase